MDENENEVGENAVKFARVREATEIIKEGSMIARGSFVNTFNAKGLRSKD